MAMNGSNTDVAIRDERGRYLKGMPGGTARPIGSRNKLTEDFFCDLHAAWQEHGREAIDRVIAERPEVFLAIVARTIDVRRVEVGRPGEFQLALSKEKILQKLEEQSGPEARRLFEEFIERVEKLDRDQQAERIGQRRRLR
jgi:hypothetical protein